MWKYSTGIVLILLFSLTTQAGCPTGVGKLLTGNDGQSTYCLSGIKMNWWSAHAWCQSINEELIDITKECIKPGQNNSKVACPNLNLVPDWTTVWTRNAPTTKGHAYYLSISGENYIVSTGRTFETYVLCTNLNP